MIRYLFLALVLFITPLIYIKYEAFPMTLINSDKHKYPNHKLMSCNEYTNNTISMEFIIDSQKEPQGFDIHKEEEVLILGSKSVISFEDIASINYEPINSNTGYFSISLLKSYKNHLFKKSKYIEFGTVPLKCWNNFKKVINTDTNIICNIKETSH